MTQPIPVPMARDLYQRLTTLERELLALEDAARALASMTTDSLTRVRACQSALRPLVLADGLQ